MMISVLARRSGVSAYRVRHYEALGLIRAERSTAGYRQFSEATVRELTFIAMSRDLGFSLKDIAATLPRYRARALTFDQLIDLLRDRIDQVDRVIAAQRLLRGKLKSHIAWVRRKQRAAAKLAPRPSFPSSTGWSR